MAIFILWVIFSLVVGAIGSSRRIGFLSAFILSLLLSPLIGLIITLISNNKDDIKRMDESLEIQRRTAAVLDAKADNKASIITEIERLANLKNQGHITEDEYNTLKSKLF